MKYAIVCSSAAIAVADIERSAEQRAKANAEMAKSSGQATKEAAPSGRGQPGWTSAQGESLPADVHGVTGDSKSTFEKLKETAKTEKSTTR